ncbi:MAG: T9SS type A sorting domain-containing protein [Bacteroidota bacterium]
MQEELFSGPFIVRNRIPRELLVQTSTSYMSQDFYLSGLAKGVYFVKVSSKQASGNYKIVID